MKVLMSIAAAYMCMQTVLSCACLPTPTLNQIYCNVDFVVKVEIRNNSAATTDPYGQPYYTIEVIEVYKPKDGTSLEKKDRLHTSNTSCGFFGLIEGERYLIAGKLRGDDLTVEGCDVYVTKYPLINTEFLDIVNSQPEPTCTGSALNG